MTAGFCKMEKMKAVATGNFSKGKFRMPKVKNI